MVSQPCRSPVEAFERYDPFLFAVLGLACRFRAMDRLLDEATHPESVLSPRPPALPGEPLAEVRTLEALLGLVDLRARCAQLLESVAPAATGPTGDATQSMSREPFRGRGLLR